MQKLARNKSLFIGLSCLSLACLVGAFSNSLQKMEVWKQKELGAFNIEYERYYILTDTDGDYPFGFDASKSQKVRGIYQDYKVEKIGLLFIAVLCAGTAMNIGYETCIGDEIDSEVEQIQNEGKKQLIIEGIKHRLAMASKSQRLLFMDEMKALIEEFGSVEGEILETDELNATDKFTNAGYLLSEGHSIDLAVAQTWGHKAGSNEHTEMKRKFQEWQGEGVSEQPPIERTHDFRDVFPEALDQTTWKAICKSLADGSTKSEIVSEVLGCSDAQRETGNAYFTFLKNKFLDS